MTDIGDPDLFAAPGTYMGVPYSHDLSGARAAVLGLPFDCATHPRRVGARLGPAAIRQHSTGLIQPFRPSDAAGFNPLARLGLVDCGDVRVVSGKVGSAMARMEEAVGRIVDAGTIPICMGGDGMVSLPTMRALAKRHSGLSVLHFDAHTDAYVEAGEDPLNPATTFTYAAKERAVDAARSFHVGTRGTTSVPGVIEHGEALGYRIIPMDELARRGVDDVLAELRRALEGRPVFLCFDMDFFDPSVAPGVFTPAWGGASAQDGLALLRGLSGLSFVGFDVNTVSPLYDEGGRTSFLAATVMLEMCYLAAASLGLSNE